MINVGFCIDDNYLMPACIMIKSMLDNNRAENIHFYTISNDLSENTQKCLKELITEKNSEIEFIELPNDIISVFSGINIEVSHISKATFYRLAIPYFLPVDVDKFIYTDCDVLIRGSIEALFELELNTKCIAGVKDVNAEYFAKKINVSRYINAGVLLIDINKWKQLYDFEQLMKKVKTICSENNLLMGDQDIINILFDNDIIYIEDRYNYQKLVFKKYAVQNRKEVKDAIIVHFITSMKPWKNNYVFPYTMEYYKYLREYLSFSKKICYWIGKIKGLYVMVRLYQERKRRNTCISK